MSWKKHLVAVPQGQKLKAAIDRVHFNLSNQSAAISSSKFSSYLPEVYAGQPNRVERYYQFENMDRDPEINAALNVIADFCTQTEEQNNLPFKIEFHEDATDAEVEILNIALQKWCKINQFKQRLWRIVRSTFIYGDQFFVRDPDTYKWFWVSADKVESIIVNEAEGKKPEQYIIRDLDMNVQNLMATMPVKNSDRGFSAWAGTTAKAPGPITPPSGYGVAGTRFSVGQNSSAIDAQHVIHLSMSEGLDSNWPFGNSILEPIFKVFKQKELLEDSVIIYRVQRAPERRVFYIDVGNAPTHKAMEFVNRIKNEIHQRRIPSQTGGGTSIMDAAYNPLSIIEDYFFPQTSDGRGSKVETLQGGESLGEINDLLYFNNKILRGLNVPTSYIPTGVDDSNASTYNDGKVGTAYMQEFRFSKFCRRLQNQLTPIFDREFKLYLKNKGIQIEAGMYDLEFCEPENFSKFRQMEIDSAQIGVFQPLMEVGYFSKRFLMKRYLNLTEEEIAENEKLWKEENPDSFGSEGTDEMADSGMMGGLSSVGVRAGPGEIGDMTGLDMGGEAPEGGEGAAPEGEGAAPEGGAEGGGELQI